MSSKSPDIATVSVPDTLGALKASASIGLTHAEVELRRREHGHNEVAEKKSHPMVAFLGKFWGLSAWILELIMVLSAVLGNYSDRALVGALLVINSVVGFMQERRAAGVVEALRQRLQCLLINDPLMVAMIKWRASGGGNWRNPIKSD